MLEFKQVQSGTQLLADGRSDEDVEHLTGMSLLEIIGLRGAAAAAPGIITEVLLHHMSIVQKLPTA